MNCETLLSALRRGAYNDTLAALYPSAEAGKARALRVTEGLLRRFAPAARQW